MADTPTVYNLPERKVETAFATYLATAMQGLGVSLQTRFANAEIVLPALCIFAESAEPQDLNIYGNWTVNIVLEVRSKRGDTSPQDHDNIIGTVTDLILQPTLPNILNEQGVTGFTAMLATIGQRRNRVEEDTQITEQRIAIDCCMS